ncbi:MAG: hypothetical protein ABF608_03005 [Sporolactobacillus sp.]
MNKWTKLFMVSVLAVAGLLTITSCNTTIKVGYMPLKTAGSTRNVVATGKYALYTQPGTVKGAKLVASKSKMAKFASYTRADLDFYKTYGRNYAYKSSTNYSGPLDIKPKRTAYESGKGSTYYFRAYGYKITHTGSVYYRVVTMNGKYRGYVYGGKKVGSFAGGVKKATTTQPTTIPANLKKNYVGVVTPGSVWNYPPYTQYKTKSLGQKSDFENSPIPSLAKFKVIKAVKRTREQDTYYYLKSQKSTVPSGWVHDRYVRSYSEIQ